MALSWTTKNEIDYIKSMGTHSKSWRVKGMSFEHMLRKYLNAAYKRTDWGNIDRVRVIAFVKAELRLCGNAELRKGI